MDAAKEIEIYPVKLRALEGSKVFTCFSCRAECQLSQAVGILRIPTTAEMGGYYCDTCLYGNIYIEFKDDIRAAKFIRRYVNPAHEQWVPESAGYKVTR